MEFVDPYDASEAQYRMNGQRFGGRVITVVVAAETRKKPDEMRHRERPRYPICYSQVPNFLIVSRLTDGFYLMYRGPSGHDVRRSYYGKLMLFDLFFCFSGSSGS